MTIDELQKRKPLDGLVEALREDAIYWEDYLQDPNWGKRYEQWADEVEAIQSALTQVGEEE